MNSFKQQYSTYIKIFIFLFIFLLFLITDNIDNNILAKVKNITINTTYGPVIGNLQQDIAVFKGIPYATPPVGELRFAPPKDPTPWTQPLAAFQFSPMAFQTSSEAQKGDSNSESEESELPLP
ncbi:MAG: carboxylesterase family protein [Deltaproteobacteria bacterium]|jgi:hypothetical protein|nr:carboxylesterase family protein [Deltaproteobacteria bacterium]